MAEQSVTLQPGESKVVSFEAIPHEAKVYQVSVNGLTGNFIATEAPTPAKFEYVSLVRRQSWPGPSGWGGIKFEIDIKNTGGTAGTCTPIAYINTCYGMNTVNMGTKTIGPGETVTFSGQWSWPHGPMLPDEWWRGEEIISEAGTITFWGVTREPSLLSIDLPSVAAGGEFWPQYTFFLPKPWGSVATPTYYIEFKIEGVRYPLIVFWVLPYGNNVACIAYLDNPKGIYTYRGNYGWTQYPYKRIWVPVKAPTAPGTYALTGSIFASKCIGVGYDSYEYTIPQKLYDLGIVGYLQVT